MKFTALVAAAALPMLWSGAAEAESLGQKALKKLFPGSFQAIVSGIIPVSITARGDGSLIGRMKSKTDTGRWSVEGGRLCIRFENWMGGRVSCSPVVLDGEWYRVASVKFRKL